MLQKIKSGIIGFGQKVKDIFSKEIVLAKVEETKAAVNIHVNEGIATAGKWVDETKAKVEEVKVAANESLNDGINKTSELVNVLETKVTELTTSADALVKDAKTMVEDTTVKVKETFTEVKEKIVDDMIMQNNKKAPVEEVEVIKGILSTCLLTPEQIKNGEEFLECCGLYWDETTARFEFAVDNMNDEKEVSDVKDLIKKIEDACLNKKSPVEVEKCLITEVAAEMHTHDLLPEGADEVLSEDEIKKRMTQASDAVMTEMIEKSKNVKTGKFTQKELDSIESYFKFNVRNEGIVKPEHVEELSSNLNRSAKSIKTKLNQLVAGARKIVK